jgi:hypothetical protein
MDAFLCGPKLPTEQDLRIVRSFDAWLQARYQNTLMYNTNCTCGGKGFVYQCCGHVVSDGVLWPEEQDADQ